jgi:hypothetical protein
VILADAVAQTVISNSALTHSWLGLSRRTPKHLRKGIGNSYFGKPVLTGNVSIRRGRFKGGVWKRDARFFLTALDLYAELFRDFWGLAGRKTALDPPQAIASIIDRLRCVGVIVAIS